MTPPSSIYSCPSEMTLSSWLDHELGIPESQRIQIHMEQCGSCRKRVLAWVEALGAIEPQRGAATRPRPGCLDPEVLVAYSEAQVQQNEAARIEAHLLTCTHCVNEIQRLVRLRIAMGDKPTGAEEPVGAPELESIRPTWHPVPAALDLVARKLARLVRRPFPGVGALAAAACLLVVLGRLLSHDGVVGGARYRGFEVHTKVEVIADEVAGRARPGEEHVVVAMLGRGTVANRLAESGGWTRIELADGRRAWVRSAAIRLLPRVTP